VRKKAYRVIVFWQDGGVEDADELTVSAVGEEAALAEASRQWRLAFGPRWPTCKIVDTELLGGVATFRRDGSIPLR